MPFSGDTYALPAGSLAANGSMSNGPTQHNAPLQDIETAINAVKAEASIIRSDAANSATYISGTFGLLPSASDGSNVSGALATLTTLYGNNTSDIKRGAISVGRGDWKMDSTLSSVRQSLELQGQGFPILRWDGAAGADMVQLRDSSHCLLSGMILLGKSGATPNAAISFDDTGSSVGTNENLVIERVQVGRRWSQDAGNGTGFVYGLFIGGALGVNNDQFYVKQSEFHDCSTAGAYIQNAQSVWGYFEDVLFNACGIGLYAGSNSQARNLMFNRNTVCDIVILRDTVHDYISVNAENSARIIDQTQNASIRITGGKVLLSNTLMTDAYWAQFAATKNVHFENWLVDPGVTTGKKVKFTASSTQRGNIKIAHCALPNGDLRTGYELRSGTGAAGLLFDIEQGFFRAKGRLDGTLDVDPPSLAAGGNSLHSFAPGAAAGIVSGDPALGSFSVALGGLMLCANIYSNNLMFARFYNKTAGAIDLPAGLLRWRKFFDRELLCKATDVYDVPSLAAGAGDTRLVAVPCSVGDFVAWSASIDTRSMLMTSYVAAPNQAALRFQNESGGALNLASATYSLLVVDPKAFDFVGAAIFDAPSLAAGAVTSFTVSVKGAKVGDFAMVAFAVDLAGMTATAEISADDTATVTLYNGTASPIDLASTAVRVGAFIALG